MIGWLIVTGSCFVVGIVFLILAKNFWEFEITGFIFGILLEVFAFTFLLITLLLPYSARTQIGQFQSQKLYIETHISKGQYDDVAITQKKIEMNQWLFNAQQGNLVYGIFTFYPDSIQDLEPIQ